ncbi:RsfA family transcriptional regulator [Pseudalkalibacillus berkeleyi]|uniref:RsfA family transcriptional regulator n=1 Tax=Pseudalkalibacillus berkeleyi TaxID=1069813 RepID=A0ABS9GW10_9BACL|nr:RsfA family transcriptional regulator [Pseudalkalibacillus berkeleyi]MCF6136997.1 RsfA family transcriptional regulator [Pseudalkalibacillus berkeleyi]
MGSTRQDAWNHDEDLLLAEVVLRHIREGGTQLAAFEEVGRKLSRTSAACGFRWNSLLRKRYDAAIAIAKKQRKTMNQTSKPKKANEKQRDQVKVMSNNAVELSLDEVIQYLQTLQETEAHSQAILSEYHQLQDENANLIKQNKALSIQYDQLQNEYEKIHEDHKVLLNFMDRARKMAISDDESAATQVKFQMDYNGNLEKIEK